MRHPRGVRPCGRLARGRRRRGALLRPHDCRRHGRGPASHRGRSRPFGAPCARGGCPGPATSTPERRPPAWWISWRPSPSKAERPDPCAESRGMWGRQRRECSLTCSGRCATGARTTPALHEEPSRARHDPPRHHRSGGRAAADDQRGRLALDRLQRRDLQPPGTAARPGGPGAPIPEQERYRGDSPPVRGRGERCVDRLRGMFAIAIWDAARATLFLARDRLGKKPLYYRHQNGLFLFASEIKALLCHPAVSRQVNLDAFHHYLAFGYTPAEDSIFAGIANFHPPIPPAPPGQPDRARLLAPARRAGGGAPPRNRDGRPSPPRAPGGRRGPPGKRRPLGRLPERRHRFQRGRRLHAGGHQPAHRHLLHRVRRFRLLLRRASVRPPGGPALRDRSHRGDPGAQGGRSPPRAGRSLRRAVRGFVGHPHLRGGPGHGPPRQGRALRRSRATTSSAAIRATWASGSPSSTVACRLPSGAIAGKALVGSVVESENSQLGRPGSAGSLPERPMPTATSAGRDFSATREPARLATPALLAAWSAPVDSRSGPPSPTALLGTTVTAPAGRPRHLSSRRSSGHGGSDEHGKFVGAPRAVLRPPARRRGACGSRPGRGSRHAPQGSAQSPPSPTRRPGGALAPQAGLHGPAGAVAPHHLRGLLGDLLSAERGSDAAASCPRRWSASREST